MANDQKNRKTPAAVWYFIMIAALIGFLIYYASINQKKPDSQGGADMPATSTSDSSATSDTSSAVSMSDSVAPDFALKDSSQNEIHLSDYRGKVVIVDFWATWCPSCRQEIPGFMDLQKRYGGKGLQVIGVSVDSKGWQAIAPFMKKQGVNYPVLLATGDVIHAYGNFNSIPMTFLIDKQGKIVKVFDDVRPEEDFEKEITRLL